MTMILSICGSRGVTVDVGPSAWWEAPGGLAVTYGLYDGPLTFMLTEQEARQLDAMLAEQLASAAERAAVGHRPCGKGGTVPLVQPDPAHRFDDRSPAVDARHTARSVHGLLSHHCDLHRRLSLWRLLNA